MNQIKAILFDMDGILINSMPQHTQAWIEAWHENEFPVTHDDVIALSGVPTRETIEIICQKYGRDFTDEVMIKIAERKKIIKKSLPPDQPFTGMADILKHYQKQGILLGIVSGSSLRNIGCIQEQFFPDLFLTAIGVGSTQRGKPFPDPFLAAMEELQIINPGLSAQDIAVVEDGIPGLKGAREAGMATWAIATTLSPQELSPWADQVFMDHQHFYKWTKMTHPLFA